MGYDMTFDTISLYLYGSVIFGPWSCFKLFVIKLSEIDTDLANEFQIQ